MKTLQLFLFLFIISACAQKQTLNTDNTKTTSTKLVIQSTESDTSTIWISPSNPTFKFRLLIMSPAGYETVECVEYELSENSAQIKTYRVIGGTLSYAIDNSIHRLETYYGTFRIDAELIK